MMAARDFARIAKHTRCKLLVATDAPGVPTRMALFAGDEFDIQVWRATPCEHTPRALSLSPTHCALTQAHKCCTCTVGRTMPCSCVLIPRFRLTHASLITYASSPQHVRAPRGRELGAAAEGAVQGQNSSVAHENFIERRNQ